MLRNAGRNTESLVSTRAVYDGGESKVHLLGILRFFSDLIQDGLPMICIILRNIDTESADYELLLFGYLKVTFRSFWESVSYANPRRLQAVCGTGHLVF
jgi:neurofibromin 1